MYPQQLRSVEGLKFELFSRLDLSVEDCQDLLTALGNLSMEAKLGDRHTVNVSSILPNAPFDSIRLSLCTECLIDGDRYGIYEVTIKQPVRA
jgi:hypothetical protein